LASRIEDIQAARMAIDTHLLSVQVLDGRVIILDEDILAELDRQARFANTAIAQ